MQNTISPKFSTATALSDAQRQRHKSLVKWSGYAALGFGTVCGTVGFKQVKIPNKHLIHKYSGYLAGITSFLHFGIVKGLDRFFCKK